MKISIITVTLNSAKSIAYTLYSVFQQSYKNIEHIIVDGGSTDGTLNILKQHKIKNKKIYILKKGGIYKAINFGILKSTGDFIVILNSDDIFNSPNTLKDVSELLIKNKNKVVLGDIVYFNQTRFERIVRTYSAINFKTWMLSFGMMPPHPGAFIPKNIAKKILYNVKYKIAADFDFFLKIFYKFKYKFFLLKMITTRMRTGGISGRNLLSHIKSSFEIYKSINSNKLRYTFFILPFLRFLYKFPQFILAKRKFKLFKIDKYYKKLIKYDFNIISNPKKIDFNKNFVLSAINLAFLGSLVKKEIKLNKNSIYWPDGKYSLNFLKTAKKIPGRDLIKKIKLKNNIKKLVVVGDLPELSRKFLEKKFSKKIIQYDVPYGNIKKIIKSVEIKLKKHDLCLITLPTPKQEIIAEKIQMQNKNFKIICIGGSVNMASGMERPVPNFFYNFEFLWRLQYDTLRRAKRLISSFYYYLYGQFILRSFINMTSKKI
jgi:exopolysaccharide biosynthesis WecB/TagA/CpsF family protein